MILNKLQEYFQTLRKGSYQRDNFDSFLKKTKFKYQIPSIHIAGTNGKGTTANCLYQCLLNEGKYKVGKFTSPYDLSPVETISINNTLISEEEYFDIIHRYEKFINKYNLSSFEVETIVALTYFMDNNCDITIIECGMGGEDDATNIFTPILSIITSISLEHTSFLGESLGEIALAKGGIIKENVPVLIPSDLDEEAQNAIINVAKDNDSKVILSDNYIFEHIENDGYKFTVKPYEDLFVPSLALFTLKDVALALSGLKLIKERFPVSDEAVYKGVLNTPFKGRFTVIKDSHPKIIVDGAHNPEAIHALVESLEKSIASPIHVVFCAFKDKNINYMLGELNFLSKDISLTTFDHPRAKKEDEYFLFLEEYSYEEDAIKLIQKKMNEYKDDVILVTGSLAFSYYIIDHKEEILKAYEE